MKKYLMIGVAALAFAVTLTSCSKAGDLYDESRVEQQKEATVNEKYAAAFEKAFGKVGPNVDWGFSSKSSSTRAFTRAGVSYADSKGNTQPTLNPPFPSDCAASNFLAEVPAGVEKLPKNGGGAKSWYIDEAYDLVQTYGGAAKLYVKGTVDLSVNDGDASATTWIFQPSNTTEVYLLEGSKLILGAASAKNFNVAAIYIAEGATLQSDYSLWANNLTKIYNHGNIIVGSFEPNTSSSLYNVGTMTAGSVTAESNPTRIVNDGTINCESVTVKAGAVQNNDQWNVRGTTFITSENSGWVNNGHWTTYNYAYVGGSWNVINNCFLEVTNDFEMNIASEKGAFKIDGGGGVLTTNFYGGRDSSTGAVSGPFVIVMGPKAVFKVTETAQLESSRDDDNGFGIFGPTEGEYAVFQAKDIVRNPYLQSISSHGAVAYGGHLYVSAETHFAQGYDSDGTGTYTPRSFIIEKPGFSIDNNIYGEGFKSGKPSITIPETPCSPGFIGGNPLYRVIAEDLSASDAGDFDFNDVVFDVVKYENSKTTLRLQACGGTLPLMIGSNNGEGGVEVHSLYGDTEPDATTGKYKMWNTGQNSHAAVDFEISGQYTTPEQLLGLRIEVFKENKWMLLTANKGVAACKILVDDRFPIVPERKSIANANGNFTTYVTGNWNDNDNFWWIQTK